MLRTANAPAFHLRLLVMELDQIMVTRGLRLCHKQAKCSEVRIQPQHCLVTFEVIEIQRPDVAERLA